ncbi:MAG: hypothetical protein ABFD49_07290 [Armatimonadota bacterium]|nr:hypothetical protein [bacterium]
MIGLKRRKKIEGWACPNDDCQNAGTIQRIGDSNKLWITAVAAVVLFCAFFVFQARRESSLPQEYGGQPGFRGKGTYYDQAHTAFVDSFVTNKSYGSAVESARFIDQERFEIVAKRGVSADEISYAAAMAARIILEKFRQRVVVEIYEREPSGKRLLAHTVWDSEKLGYVVKFNNDQSDIQ